MSNLYNLKGKTAWIIGGKRIGQNVCEILAQHGANVIMSYNTSKKEAQESVDIAKRYGVLAIAIQTDATLKKSIKSALEKITKHFEKIDILVLMASIFEPARLEDISEDNLQKNFDVHVKGTFFPIQSCLGIIPRGGHIITISDRTSIGKVYKNYLPYIITKGAVAHLTRTLSIELAPRGIFINSIAPGPVLKADTMTDEYWQNIRKNSMIGYPLDDLQATLEFAKLVLYLSTVRSTGYIYPLDFGYL